MGVLIVGLAYAVIVVDADGPEDRPTFNTLTAREDRPTFRTAQRSGVPVAAMRREEY
jgi:hypothetical protein